MSKVLFQILSFSLSIALFCPQSQAQTPQKLYEEGLVAFQTGDYENAIERFQSAYKIEPKPILLYNIAVSHGRLNNYSEATRHGELADLQGLTSPWAEKNKARLIGWRVAVQSRAFKPVIAKEKIVGVKIDEPVTEVPSKRGWLIASIATLGAAAIAGGTWTFFETRLADAVDQRDIALNAGDSTEADRILNEEIKPKQTPARVVSIATLTLSGVGIGLLIYALIPTRTEKVVTVTPTGIAVSF